MANSALREGAAAFGSGQRCSANLHAGDLARWLDWREGWEQGRAAAEAAADRQRLETEGVDA